MEERELERQREGRREKRYLVKKGNIFKDLVQSELIFDSTFVQFPRNPYYMYVW